VGILQEKVFKIRTETATENGMGQAGSYRYCRSHSSVASSIGPEQRCVFTHLLSQNSHTL